jgi:hypothetical protein
MAAMSSPSSPADETVGFLTVAINEAVEETVAIAVNVLQFGVVPAPGPTGFASLVLDQAS